MLSLRSAAGLAALLAVLYAARLPSLTPQGLAALWPQLLRPRPHAPSPPATMAAAKVASVGSWVSPISSKLLTAHSKRLGAVSIGCGGQVFWLEGRPAEQGRQVLVTRRGGEAVDVIPGPESGFNVRTRVHEYGGGDTVFGPAELYFSNFADQRLYVQELTAAAAAPAPAAPRALTPEGKLRYADGVLDAGRSRLVVVCEDHSGEGEAVSTVAAVDLATGAATTLVSGSDFYASPRLSPDGSRLAWVSWDHPNMPWDDTTLWVGEVDAAGAVGNPRKVAGGEGASVMQPQWGPDGALYFISDAPSGWWNVFREKSPGQVEAVCPMEAEVGGPAWLFGSKAYHVLRSGQVLAVYSNPKAAGSKLAVLDPSMGSVTDIDTGFSSFGGSLAVNEEGGRLTVALVGASALQPPAVVMLQVEGVEGLKASKPTDWEVLATSTALQVDPGYLSEPEVVEFPTEQGLTAFMNFYPPKNQDYVLPEGERPPLLVKIHGGPTAQASSAFSLAIQYWTSRGYAIADVNYGGSTGYGRAYRMRLRGQWGVVDVADCCNAARHLVTQSLVDPKRLCISGGSAGGYTTLACLAFSDVFAAGASHYGVADLELLAKETHKFESRYLDNLIAPYPAGATVYEERSPIKHLDKLSAPTAFFQGLEDQIVPPNQAELMFAELKERGIPTALVLFEGEQHGFRQSTNIRRALDGELFFYGKALGFPAEMPDDLEPIELVNI